MPTRPCVAAGPPRRRPTTANLMGACCGIPDSLSRVPFADREPEYLPESLAGYCSRTANTNTLSETIADRCWPSAFGQYDECWSEALSLVPTQPVRTELEMELGPMGPRRGLTRGQWRYRWSQPSQFETSWRGVMAQGPRHMCHLQHWPTPWPHSGCASQQEAQSRVLYQINLIVLSISST